MKKFNFENIQNQWSINYSNYENEVIQNKKLFDETKEEICKEFDNYLELVKDIKEVKITKDLKKVIMDYQFTKENYPFEIFNIPSNFSEYYLGCRDIGLDWCKINKLNNETIINQVDKIKHLFSKLQTLNKYGPDRYYKDDKIDWKEIHKYEEEATHIFGRGLQECYYYLYDELKTKYNMANYNYKKPIKYSDKPTSFDYSFKNVSSKQIEEIKTLIKQAGFEIVKDEILKKNIVEDLGNDLCRIDYNYKVGCYVKEINELKKPLNNKLVIE